MPEPDEPLDLPPVRRLSRRGFVKGCLYATAAGVAAAGGGGVVAALGLGGGKHRRVDYVGVTVVSGPAPQGVPLVPLAVGDDGLLMGNPDPPEVGRAVLDWYRYCGHDRSPVLQAEHVAADEGLVYAVSEDKVPAIRAWAAQTGREDVGWYLDLVGKPVRVANFRAPGHGAPVAWRGELTATVLKVDPAALTMDSDLRRLVEGFLVPTQDGMALLATSNFCKHFCCAPGWHETALSAKYDAVEKLYCSCHNSVFDPLLLRRDFFMMRET